jgi:hypothetical protein
MWKDCPNCGTSLEPPRETTRSAAPGRAPAAYDPVETWRRLVLRAESLAGPPRDEDLLDDVLAAARGRTAGTSIVHIVFDRHVTPQGGLLWDALAARGAVRATASARLAARGYVVEDGAVRTHDGVPVGRIWFALQRWGGDPRHRRWRLRAPIEANPSRHGSPAFMDGPLVAFRADWEDLSRFEDALRSLVTRMREGHDVPIGHPMVVHVHWVD